MIASFHLFDGLYYTECNLVDSKNQKVEAHNGVTKDHNVVAKNQYNAMHNMCYDYYESLEFLMAMHCSFFMLWDQFWDNIDEKINWCMGKTNN